MSTVCARCLGRIVNDGVRDFPTYRAKVLRCERCGVRSYHVVKGRGKEPRKTDGALYAVSEMIKKRKKRVKE